VKARFFLQQGPKGFLAEFHVIQFNIHPEFEHENLKRYARCGVNFCLAMVELINTSNYDKIPKEKDMREVFAESSVYEMNEFQNEDAENNKTIISGYPLKYVDENR
jgi:hypothetical protein